MKRILFLMISSILFSCNHSTKSSSVDHIEIDPLKKHYMLEKVIQSVESPNNAFYFIYPSYCGACTDSVMKLIKENPLKSFRSYFIIPDVDSLDPQLKKYSFGGMKFMDSNEMGRHGLQAAHNQIFVFRDTSCIYYAKMSSETVPFIRTELLKLESEYAKDN